MPVIENNLGKISINPNVLGIIAGMAAMECYGLVGMVSGKVKAGLYELLGREDLKKGVELEFTEDSRVSITLNIVVEYGINMSEVANNVIERVEYTVENSTGLQVEEVNINVRGVRVGN